MDERLTSLSDSADLGRLKVGERQSRLRLPLKGELLKVVQHLGRLGDQEVKSIPDEDELGVVCHVAAGGSIVNETSGIRSNLAESVNVL